jgi:hypothetical protein
LKVRISRKRRGLAYGGANLNEVLADRLAVVHCVEGCDFVDAHGRHLQHAGDLVHNANAGEAVLTLTEVQQRHNGGLLVLGRVALEDLIGDLEVLLGELEGKGRVVVRLVAVLIGEEKELLAQLTSLISSDRPGLARSGP